ncbi:MAG: outer membrane protein transport protein [Ignavibacteriaceae bacterium]
MKVLKVFLLTIFIFSAVGHAQTIGDALRVSESGLGVGARALGMGNAFNGISDDASAMYFNPAGLGLIKRLEVAGGLDYFNYKNDATLFNNKTNYSSSATNFNQISFVFPFPTLQGSMVFGMSYNKSKDFTSALKFNGFNIGSHSMIQSLEEVKTPLDDQSYKNSVPYNLFLSDDTGKVSAINGKLNQSGTTLQEGGLNSWTFSGSMEVSKNLFVGSSLNINSGTFKSNREFYEDDTKGIYTNIETAPGNAFTKNFTTFYRNDILDWEISGWDLKLGTMYQLSKLARFGITIQFPKTFTIKETYTFDARSEFGNNIVNLPSDLKDLYSDKVEYDITTPFVLTGAASVNVKGLILSGEATLTDYSQTEFSNAKGISASYFASLNKDMKELLRAVAAINIGVEYTIPQVGVRVRGGFISQPSPYKGDPSDFGRKYLTGGIGFLADETFAIDVAYAHGWWKTYGDNYGTNLSRVDQDIATDKMLVTFSYRF